MKITNIRLRRLTGHMPVEGPFFEDRLLQPTDVYEEFRNQPDRTTRGSQINNDTFEVDQTFVQIETDEGVSGICGGMFPGVPWHVWQLKDLLIGQNPLATEFLWDIMHRRASPSSTRSYKAEPTPSNRPKTTD